MKSTDGRCKRKICRFSKEWLFLQAFLTALALNTELGVADDEIDGINNVLLAKFYALFAQIESGISTKGFFLTVLTVALFVGYIWVSRKEQTLPPKKHIGLAAFLAMMYTGGMVEIFRFCIHFRSTGCAVLYYFWGCISFICMRSKGCITYCGKKMRM